jgi:drug/metabolite transporter (DMT)-like permease
MKLKNAIILFITALIWGVAFVAQSVGMDYVQPFTFNAVRSLIGGIVLIPCIFVLKRFQASDTEEKQEDKKTLWIGGICCGVALCIASNLQQIGIQYTSVGKAGFITALYIILVPILSIFLKKKAGIKVWTSVFIAVVGLYLLCMTEELRLSQGDFLILLCALAFSIHILIIDYFSPKVDGVKMSCIQFLICGLISLICMFVTEQPQLSSILAAWQPILYAGILSCGVAYTLQIIGQKGMNPTISSLILSLESVISVLAGWLILNQQLSRREFIGCVLMFLAIILAQLPDKSRN